MRGVQLELVGNEKSGGQDTQTDQHLYRTSAPNEAQEPIHDERDDRDIEQISLPETRF
jgi:hypothetical protein